ncbi:transketolase [Nematocida parisii]|nr:transketolase [Nematocida parisii]
MGAVQEMRLLVAQIVQNAGEGHPGSAIGMAPLFHVLYSRVLKITKCDLKWSERDILVLSNGHSVAILYAALFCRGVLTEKDLKEYRQIGSKTPGHPEYSRDNAIDATTGPLGQGVAQAVGYAISISKKQKNNRVFCILGDGCMQEGISQEAFSLAGHLQLKNLFFVFDSNKITIDGATSYSTSDDAKKRMESMNYEVLEVDAEDTEGIEEILGKQYGRPVFLIMHSVIGKDTSVENNRKAHGSPLGEAEVAKLQEKYNLCGKSFYISESTKEIYRKREEEVAQEYMQWKERQIDNLKNANAGRTCNGVEEVNMEDENKKTNNKYEKEFVQMLESQNYVEKKKPNKSTREIFGDLVPGLLKNPNILGGSADLTESTCLGAALTKKPEITEGDHSCQIDPKTEKNTEENQNFIHFGIREHAMCGIVCGIALFGEHRAYCSTFLNFLAYGFPAVRIAALSEAPSVYIATHDSIALGGDGPTHQPVEMLALLRATPGLITFRPASRSEVEAAVLYAFYQSERPCVIILSRQGIEEIPEKGIRKNSKVQNTGTDNKLKTDVQETEGIAENQSIYDNSAPLKNTSYISRITSILQGAHIISDYSPDNSAQKLLLLATGSEVPLALRVKPLLNNYNVRVVSLLSFELFQEQPQEYVEDILFCDISVSIEALSTFGWDKYAQVQIGVDTFGASGPTSAVYEYFGFTPEKITDKIHNEIKKKQQKEDRQREIRWLQSK